MPRIDLNDTPFAGVSRSVAHYRSAKPPRAECRICGSSLAGRRVKVHERTIAGVRYLVETYRCRGGHGREIRRPVDTGAAAG